MTSPAIPGTLAFVLLGLIGAPSPGAAAPARARARPGAAPRGATSGADFGALYRRIAADLRRGRPLVITVHVALCDNLTITCGSKRLGDGDAPATNLYWGGAAGLKAWFDHRRGWTRVLRAPGDGRTVLERVVYRQRVRSPAPNWRRLGVTRPFDVYLVGVGYRGVAIGAATKTFLEEVSTDRPTALALPGGVTLRAGGGSHVVGYAGHNHLMDVTIPPSVPFTRRSPVGWFVLACVSGDYFAPILTRGPAHALLVTKVFMYPGAFTVEGLVRGLVMGSSQAGVFQAGADLYARYQKRSPALIRRLFTHGGRRDYTSRFPRR